MITYTIERLTPGLPPEHVETTVRDERAARLAVDMSGTSEGLVMSRLRELSPLFAPAVSFAANRAGFNAVRVTAESVRP